MKLKFLISVVLTLLTSLLFATDPWQEPEVLTGSMTISIFPTLDGNPVGVSAGDVLAAFVTVAGVEQLRGKESIMVIDNDPGCLLQVFTETDDEIIQFKLWDESASEIISSPQTLNSVVDGNIGSYPDQMYHLPFYTDEMVMDPWPNPEVLTGSMTVMAQVWVNGNPAQVGDLLAAFVTTDGVEQLRGKTPIQVINGIPGCLLQIFTETANEQITFKVWDFSEQQVITATNTSLLTVVDGNVGSFPNDLFAIVAGAPAEQVSAPTFNPSGGTYYSAQLVSLMCSTPEAQIRYTLDGSDPTLGSPLYSTPLIIQENSVTTIKARAYKNTWVPSLISSETYTIHGTVADPIFDPSGGTYSQPIEVLIMCDTPGAIIYYTTDGSEPNQTSLQFDTLVPVSTSCTLKAKAYKQGWASSQTSSANYTITGRVATPEFSPPGGAYSSPQYVTISCATPGADIRYTTNGTDPTQSAQLYTSPIPIGENTTLKARAYKLSWTASYIATANYTITGTVATPVFNPAGGEYEDPIQVQITCSTAGAQIHYTLDGSEPNLSSSLYTAALDLEDDTTLKARAYLSNWEPSLIAEAIYNFSVSIPEEPGIPAIPGIHRAYPNPFRDYLTVAVGTKDIARDYQLKIFNLKGECVHIVSGSAKGAFDITWDGRNAKGTKLPRGVYLLQFSTEEIRSTKRVIMY